MRRFILKCKKEIVLFLTANTIWAVIGISLAFLLEYIADTAIQGIEKRIVYIVLLVITYLLLDTVFEFLSNYTEILLRTKFSFLLRNTLIRRIQKCGIEEKEKMGDAHYLSMLNNNVPEIEMEYIGGILMVVFQVISLIFALIATTAIQPVLTLIIIVLCVLPLVVPRILKNKLEKVNREAISAKAGYLNVLNELVEGFLTIKVFGRESEVTQFHDRTNEETMIKIRHNARWKRISMSLSYGMGNMVVLGAWVSGMIFALAGSIDFPQLIALTTLMNMVAGPFQIISEYYAGIISGHAIAEDLIKFIDSGTEEQSYKSHEANINSVELDNVSIVRDGNFILSNVHFSAGYGQKICVIGSSGSGKSTLLKAIAGIADIQGGSLLINHMCVEKNRGLTHRNLLFLAQSTILFSATIRDNVTLFKEMPGDAIEEAIHKSGMSEWLKRAGGDINRTFEKSSINLSGGEQRRIDFARTLMEDAEVLLFDEPTAGLDTFYARNIMEQICAMSNRIIVVATHDLEKENLLRFDYVYMVENGKVVAEDTPNNMVNNPMYLSLKKGGKA